MKEYKRQYREQNDETKQKISNSSRNRPKSDQHKQRISHGMKDYWQNVPNLPDDSNNEV